MPSQLWQRLRAARKYARMTQQQLADRIGVSKQSISSWESDDAEKRSVPRWENLASLSSVTGAPQKWLMDDNSDLESFWLDADDPDAGEAESGMWSAYVVVSRLSGNGGKVSDGTSGQLAYKRSWVDYKMLKPAELFSYQVATNAFAAEGISRGDTLLVSTGDLTPSAGWWVAGAAQVLVHITSTIDGELCVSDGDSPKVLLPSDYPLVARAILQSKEI